MIRKAIIEKIENNGYQAKIRIPILDKISSSPSSTNNNDLRTASICALPGNFPAYKPGDIVFVGFENNNDGSPIILGKLYCENSNSSSTNLNALSLEILHDVELPENTKIGNFSFENLDYYLDLIEYLREQVEKLQNS